MARVDVLAVCLMLYVVLAAFAYSPERIEMEGATSSEGSPERAPRERFGWLSVPQLVVALLSILLAEIAVVVGVGLMQPAVARLAEWVHLPSRLNGWLGAPALGILLIAAGVWLVLWTRSRLVRPARRRRRASRRRTSTERKAQ